MEQVYVIGEPGSRTAKIGWSIRPEKRLNEIQRMCPVKLQILWLHPGGQLLESRLHRSFGSIRSHGEWFIFESDPVAEVRAMVKNLGEEPAQLIAQVEDVVLGQMTTAQVQRHLASHTDDGWCSLCEWWPHEPLDRGDGWCSRCDVHSHDHEWDEAEWAALAA